MLINDLLSFVLLFVNNCFCSTVRSNIVVIYRWQFKINKYEDNKKRLKSQAQHKIIFLANQNEQKVIEQNENVKVKQNKQKP